MTGRAGVFLDRDGTLIEDPGYLSHPDQVRLLPGAGAAVARLNAAGLVTIVVTNQSGIARGLLTESAYRATEGRLADLLAMSGARVDAQYFCPHHPDFTGPCECRKPGTLLYRRASEDLRVDLAKSWWIGDRLRDVEPALRLGGRGILLLADPGSAEPAGVPAQVLVLPDLPAAVQHVLTSTAPA